MNLDEESKNLYFGSNQYLRDLRNHIDEILEYRTHFKYELFFRISIDGIESPVVKTATYLVDTVKLKESPRSMMKLEDIDYKEYKVFLRRLDDNYTIMLGKKIKSSLLEITENFFKL